MKEFILRQFYLLKDQDILSSTIRLTSWTFSLVISTYLLIILAIPLYQTATHKGHVFATDNDGGRAIETSMRTRWYNSNHFAPYGNLYYRLSHSIADLVSIESDGKAELESKEKTHHFSLKLISLFSLFALGLLLGWIIFDLSFVAPLFACLFTLMGIKIPLWGIWIYRPHPEHLLNLFIALAVYLFGRLLTEKNNTRLFIVSAFAWGIAMAVKRSTSIFIPGILLIFLLPLNKVNVKVTVRYVGFMLLAYLAVGFPQNFGFYKHIKFLIYESSLHSIGDLGSMTQNLLAVGNQVIYLLPLVMLAPFFSSNRKKSFTVKFLAFVLLSFIPILMRKMSFEGSQHTMPLAVSIMMLVLMTLLHFLPWRISNKFIPAVLIIVGIKMIGIDPDYNALRDNQRSCYSEFSTIDRLVAEKISPQHLFVKEPSFPSSNYFANLTSSYWGLDWNKISPAVKIFGVTGSSIRQHLGALPKEFYGKMAERWPEKNEFYRSIENRTEVISPQGIKYRKVFSGKFCDHELWMADDL